MNARTRPLLVAAALLAGALVPLAAPAVADTGPVPLGMSRAADVVVDEAHGRVFVSGGPSGPGVAVTDLTGAVTARLAFDGATGLALSPDGSRLWTAVPSFGLISIDPVTLVAKERWPVPGCPGDVAVVGTRLVYGSSCNRYSPSGGGYGGIGVLDADTGASYGTVAGGPSYQPVVAAGPAGHVYAADAGVSPTALHLYDVRGAAPVAVASRAQACSNLRDLTASLNGDRVVTSCGSPYLHAVWSSDKLVSLPAYTASSYPLAGAFAADGTFVGGIDAYYDADVRIYPAGATTPSRTYDFGQGVLLEPRGLAVSADGSRLWAVTRSSAGGLELRVLTTTQRPATALTVASDPPVFFVGERTQVGGWLSSGGIGVAGAALTVTRTGTGALPVSLPPVTTRADGTYSFADAPAEPGSYTYTVAWGGDATRGPAQAVEAVTVEPLGTSLQVFLHRTVSAPATVQGTVLLRTTTSSSAAGRTVRLVRTGAGAVTSLPDVVTDSSGTARFSDDPPVGAFTYTASVEALGGAPTTTASATIEQTPTATTLGVKAPSATFVGDPVTVAGTLLAGAQPVASASVSVVRSGCGPVQDWTTVTTTTGAWSVTDHGAPVGSCTFAASYGGDPRLASTAGTATTVVSLRPTTLTVATPGTSVAGTALTVTGRLASEEMPVAGAALSITRFGCSDTSWAGNAVTGTDGTWSLVDPEPSGGTCRYAVAYAGSPTYAAVGSTASTAVALRAAGVSASVTRATITGKKQVVVTGQLSGWHVNRTLTITAQPAGGPVTTVASGTVDAAGRFTATYMPRTTTTYRVKYAGDDWYAADTAVRTQ